ncbi:DUF2637 domain-containing protein [Streptomyces lunaelactis]|uniref:DUF2637 domain-containing protein n=1 Tax=Streptomyces lunaelactis TaxID=1535768 RepID=UPI0020C7FC4B|nr:DUF2637 domain-containing protein [Streptomyces lunaelactis]
MTKDNPPVLLTRTHRILIGVVVAGAVIIAAIGFAGSYAAVRELAEKKGFGDFSLVFPIGIDAGICVLLALDLLLTWLRIPFPLLRQTAWLLTAATIAFNGAASWPDPLGVGMHAVIPVLFVVAVEAARHAIGRIADITADRHMEGVRLTRWLLSPVPTFKLWRRMKLWELRSYEQVIKLEQDRLIYQARLQARFGRAWRRKAPIEALMPLRLARYGVPLTETAPAGLAAAGIEAPILFTLERVSHVGQPEGPPLEAVANREQDVAHLGEAEPRPVQARATTPERPAGPQDSSEEAAERFAGAYQEFLTQFQAEPTTTQWAFWLRDQYGISTGAGEPLSEEQLQPLLQVLQKRYELPLVNTTLAEEPQPTDQSWYDYFYSAWLSYQQERGAYPDAAALAAYVYERDTITGVRGEPIRADDLGTFVASFQELEFGQTEPSASEDDIDRGEPEADEPLPETNDPQPVPVGAPAAAAKEPRGPRVDAPIDEPRQPAAGGGDLTASDRYYLAWMEYQDQKGSEPSDENLSAYCAEKGLLGRGNNPVSPANLRRHFVRWRVYNVWAEQRLHTDAPAHPDVAQACAERGITARYNKPVTPTLVAEEAEDFERRWQALTRHHADMQM